MAETIRVLVSEEDVDKRIMELGKKISEDYAGKQVHLTFLRRRFEHSALKCMKSIHYPYRFRLFMTPTINNCLYN